MKLNLNNEESALNDLVEIAEQKKEEINTQLEKKKIDSDDNRIIERTTPANDREDI